MTAYVSMSASDHSFKNIARTCLLATNSRALRGHNFVFFVNAVQVPWAIFMHAIVGILRVRTLVQAVVGSACAPTAPATTALGLSAMPIWTTTSRIWTHCTDQLRSYFQNYVFDPPGSCTSRLSIAGNPSAASPSLPLADASPLLWDGLVLAAPKKKVSHSRKAMRAANKGLKDRVGT